jgi:cytoskeletal protein CcmA (bactofilin family)
MSLFRKNDEPNAPRFDDEAMRAPYAPAPKPAPIAAAEPAEPAEEERCDYLGRGSRIQGKLRFEGSVRIVGVVEGEIDATEAVVVEEGAQVSAKISASVVLVQGTVTADVAAKARLEIGSTGVLRGKVTAGALVVHDGAVFEGSCSMGGSAKPKSSATKDDAAGIPVAASA